MARLKHSYQKGYVTERHYKSGRVFLLRYRTRNPEGGWVEKTETLHNCPGKKAAQKELEKRLEAINRNNGGVVRRERKTLSDLLVSYWPDYQQSKGVRPSTRYSYQAMVKHWIEPHLGDSYLDEIRSSTVTEFMAELVEKGLGSKYRRNIYNLLRLLMDLAVEYDLIEATPIRPKIHRPKVQRHKKPVFTVEQAQAILDATDPQYRAPIATLAMTGIRAGELLGLQWRDLDFLGRRITITRSVWRGKVQSPKTETSTRLLGMPEELAAILMEHRRLSLFTQPHDFLFCQPEGRPLDPDSLREYGIYAAMARAGIPHHQRASGCHGFRHLAGTIIHRETGSLKLAQKQLGHSNVSTTGDIYTHVDDADMATPASVLGRAFRISCGRNVVETALERENVQ